MSSQLSERSISSRSFSSHNIKRISPRPPLRQQTKLEKQCFEKMSIVNRMKQKGQGSAVSWITLLANTPKEEESTVLTKEEPLHLSFEFASKRNIVIREQTMRRQPVKKTIKQLRQEQSLKQLLSKKLEHSKDSKFHSNALLPQSQLQERQSLRIQQNETHISIGGSDSFKNETHAPGVLINSNVPVSVTISFPLDSYDKTTKYTIKADSLKAITVKEYQKGEVKIGIETAEKARYAHVEVKFKWIKVDFGGQKRMLTISPQKRKKQLDVFVEQNRGRSTEILRQRSHKNLMLQTRRAESAHKSRQLLMTRTTDELRPMTAATQTLGNSKIPIKDFHSFESEKSKYLQHMMKMSNQKALFLRQCFENHNSKNSKQVKEMTAFVTLLKFMQNSRMLLLRESYKRMHKVKIEMICSKFCEIMKTKLRYRITQKARYRMAVKQSLAFLGQIFYTIQKPKVESVLLDCLMQVELYKTGKKLLVKSEEYKAKTIKVQRYFRTKRQNYSERVSLIISKIASGHNFDQRPQYLELRQWYLKKCLQSNLGVWTIRLHMNLKELKKKLKEIQESDQKRK